MLILIRRGKIISKYDESKKVHQKCIAGCLLAERRHI
jgi:hypothetical protein